MNLDRSLILTLMFVPATSNCTCAKRKYVLSGGKSASFPSFASVSESMLEAFPSLAMASTRPRCCSSVSERSSSSVDDENWPLTVRVVLQQRLQSAQRNRG